jgi:hypothetical protein
MALQVEVMRPKVLVPMVATLVATLQLFEVVVVAGVVVAIALHR